MPSKRFREMRPRIFQVSLLVMLTIGSPIWEGSISQADERDGFGNRVLVVANMLSPTSVEIAKHYVKQRKLRKVLKVECQDSALDASKETIAFEDFQKLIEEPLRGRLETDTEIDFIVLTKGVPIRLTGAPTGLQGSRPSLDSYIASMDYSERAGTVPVEIDDSGFKGKCFVNRYWNAQSRFRHQEFGGYLVTRLDGYSKEAAKRLVDQAIASEKEIPTAPFYLDLIEGHGKSTEKGIPRDPIKDGKLDMSVIGDMKYNEWDADLQRAFDRIKRKQGRGILEATDEFKAPKNPVVGYASWGSNDPKFTAEAYHAIQFVPGAIAETAVSTSGRTFLKTQGGQSLIADLIDQGVTGVKGYTDEPLLQAIASPAILFDRYSQGWTLAESFYAASRFVGWEDVVIGDPICAPFAKDEKE